MTPSVRTLQQNRKQTGGKRRTRLPTRAIAIGEVATLAHEVLDHAVEAGALVTEALLAGGQGAEVLNRLGHRLAVEADDDAAHGLIAVRDVKEHRVRDLRALASQCRLSKEEHAQPYQGGGGKEGPPHVNHVDGMG